MIQDVGTTEKHKQPFSENCIELLVAATKTFLLFMEEISHSLLIILTWFSCAVGPATCSKPLCNIFQGNKKTIWSHNKNFKLNVFFFPESLVGVFSCQLLVYKTSQSSSFPNFSGNNESTSLWWPQNPYFSYVFNYPVGLRRFQIGIPADPSWKAPFSIILSWSEC